MRRKQMKFKNKKVAFFDMDGTLIDSETLYYQTRVKVFEKHGLTWSKAENDHLLAGGFAATLHYMQKKVGDPELGKQLSDESLALYQQEVDEGKLTVKSGAKALLEFLQKAGISSYITSSSDLPKIKSNMVHTGLESYFTGIITGEDVKHNKPAPDIYLHALKVAQVEAQDAVIFEDAANGIKSGLNAGIDVIAIPDQVMPPKDLCERSTVVKTLDQAIPLFK